MSPSPESPLHGRCACGGVQYCVDCGGQVFSRPEGEDYVFVRLGAIDEDPGIRPP